jgi:hypothetical protein
MSRNAALALANVLWLLTCPSPTLAEVIAVAECSYIGRMQPCQIHRTEAGLRIAISSSPSPKILEINGQDVTLYGYLRRGEENQYFASGYHRDYATRLAKNYAYLVEWRRSSIASEQVLISFGESNTNRLFYSLMRQLTGLELGDRRED